MKKLIYIFICLTFAVRLNAQINYDDVVITPTSNTLVDDIPALGTLLPADFTSTIFDNGVPTMNRLIILMNMPAGLSDYEIIDPMPRIVIDMDASMNLNGMTIENPSFTLAAGGDVCLHYVSDGTQYVLAALPFDPTTRPFDPITIEDNTTEKVYITGHISGKLSAEMPEKVDILLPSYLNSVKQSFSDIFVSYIHSMISSMLPDFSFNPNAEGFLQFTGGESSHLHIYTDNLQMQVEDKVTDFLGSVIATNAQLNLMGIDGPTDDYYTDYTDEQLQNLTESDVHNFDENQIRSFSAEQLAIIAPKMTTEQCNWITPGQVMGLCGISDIVLALSQTDAIATTLAMTFLDANRMQNVGEALTTMRQDPVVGPFDTYSDDELQSMSTAEVEAFSADQIRSFSADQLRIIASKLSAEQCGYLNFSQVWDLCDNSSDPEEIQVKLVTVFYEDKVRNASDAINPSGRLLDAIGQQLEPLMNGSTTDKVSALLGGMDMMTAIGKIFSSMVEGAASPFAFKSNSTRIENQAFNVHIHSKGTNTITGGAEGKFVNTGTEMGVLASLISNNNTTLLSMVDALAVMFEAAVRFCSAPFAVRPSADVVGSNDENNYEYTCTRLLFDDVWADGTTHTNGIMQMPVVGKDLDAPSIDLGTANGQVEFNGGQYRFHTPVSSKSNMFYVATMAICYREFNVNMPLVGKIKYHGLGTSVGWGPSANRTDNYRNVIFRDGTFTTYSAEAWKSDARAAEYGAQYTVDAVANGWYEHYTDLRLPYNTSVLGGSFPEDTYVRRCDAAAEQGVKPVYIYIADPLDPTSPQYETPLCERKELVAAVDLADPSDEFKDNGTVKVTNDNRQMLTVKTGASSTSEVEYGTESLTPDANDKVYVYVTGECKVDRDYVRNYVTALAPFGENHVGTNMLSMGGNVEVLDLYQDLYPQKTAYLLYTQLGYYTYNYAGVNLGGKERTLQDEFQIDRSQHHNFLNTGSSTNADGQNIMTTTDTTGVVFSEITNEQSYRIEHGIYSMLPIMSDTWTMISMPYDVANVYILETTDEIGNPAWSNDQWHEFYQRQGVADGDMAQTLITSVLPDVFSGRGSGIRKPLPYILNNLTNDKTVLTKLEHYTGNNWRTANYYLKRMKSEGKAHHWKMEEEQNLYGNKWQNAPAESEPTFLTETTMDPDCTWEDYLYGDCDEIVTVFPYVDQDGQEQDQQTVVMQRDSVYVMYFPGGTNRFWNYKYLILEGYGPQRINGKNMQETFVSNIQGNMTFPEEDMMAIQGNSTFGNHDMSCSSSNPIFFVTKTAGQDTTTTIIKENGDYYTTGLTNYKFAKYSGGKRSRILPCGVYMVSNNKKAVSEPAGMPSLHGHTTDIPTLLSQQPSLLAYSDNGIYLEAYEDQHIRVFSADGRTLWNGNVKAGTTTFLPAATGLYLIQGQQSTIKLINK